MYSNGFRGRGGQGRGRGTRKPFVPRGVKETVEIPRNFSGLIIGKGGENIKKYKEKSGVYNIFISDGVTPEISIVTVDAESKNICQQILTEITGLIEYSKMNTSYKSCVQATLHEFEDDVEAIFTTNCDTLPYIDVKDGTQHQKKKPLYFIGTRKTEAAGEKNNHHASGKKEAIAYVLSAKTAEEVFQFGTWVHFNPSNKESCDHVRNLFKKMIESGENGDGQDFQFQLMPGKQILIPYSQITLTPNINGSFDGSVKKLQANPIWVSALKWETGEAIKRALISENFICVNGDTPEKFTKVHLFTCNNHKDYTVILALDESLNQVAEADDHRLTLDKKEAIAHVLNAKTVEEVFQFGTVKTSNIKVLFKKMSMLVHPDKNLHLNAEEAAKVVNHAYKELCDKNPRAPALKISNLATESNKKPPKVIALCERKRKLGTLSFVSKNPLDLRASVAVKGAKATVPKLMRVLEESWHLRDAEGGLATPEFDTGIQFKMCKQILEKFIYVKDLGDLGVIEVAVEKMRSKLMAAKEWNHTCEVTFTVAQQGKENLFCPSAAVDALLHVKEIWANITEDL